MKRRLLGKIAGYITYSTVIINKTYGDIDFINPITITGDGTITYSSNNTTVATINQNTGQVTILKPGEAIITATVTDSDYYSYETKNIIYTLSVAKAAGNVSEPPASATVPYTGNQQQLVTPGSGTGTMMYKLNNGTWSTEIPTAINCDTYTIYYKSSENDYYTESAVGSLQVTITLSTPDYTAPTAKVLVYNGNELELLNAGSTSDGTFYYSTDNSTWSESIPKGINADSYITYWKLEGDNNHTSIPSTRVDVTIDKAENSLTATKHDDWTYDGESYALVSDVSGQGNITYSLNGGSDSLIIPQASDAGTYVVKVKATGNSNYYSKEISYTIVVSKVTPTVTVASRTVTYNRSALNLITSGGSDFGTLLFSLDETNWSTTIPTATNAGVYLVYYRVIGDSNINDIESTAVSPISEISPKSVTADMTLSYITHVYTGEALTPTVTAKDGSITIPSTEYTVNYTNNINSGTATVTLTDKANGNYIVTGSTTFVITKADGRIDVLPVGKDLVYTGESQVIATAGSGTGVMYYALEQDPTYSSDIPSLVNAGTYTMYFYAAESTNYTQSTTKSIEITIAKANPTYTAPTAKTGLVYSGEALVLLNAGSIASGNGTLQYSSDNSTWSGTIPSRTNAGQYTSYWRIVGNSNYNDKESTSITTTITKHAGVINTVPTKKNLTYNGNSQALVTAGSGSGTMLYKLGSDGTWSNNIPTGTIVGDYDIYYKVLESSNYFATDGSTYVTSSISKVTPTVEAPTAKNLTYTGEALTLINAGTTNWGTLKYSLDNSTYSTSLPTGTNATTYTVYYRVDGDSNINNVAAKSIAVTIAKAAPSYTAPTAKTGLVYNTSAQALLNGGSASGGTLLYSSDNSTWGTTIPTGTNAGSYTSYWRIVGDSNHSNKASTSINTTISPKTVDSPTITLSPSSYTYSGNQCNPTPTVKDGTVTISSGEYTVSYNDNVNAGTATCTITDKSGGNYTVSGSKTFTISKVTPTVTAPTAKVLTYNSSALTLANAGSTNFGTLKYSLDNSTWSTSIPTATNSGSYTLYYKVDGNSNVNSVSASSINCSINEKLVTATVTLSPTSYTYDGNAKTPTVTVKDGSTVIPSSEYTVTYSNNTNAGTATVTITDKTGGNYNVIGSATFTINKAAGSVTTKPTAKSLTYNGNAQALVNAGYGTETIYYSLSSSSGFSTSIPTGTAAGPYTVYFYAAASSNYNQSTPTESVSVQINQASDASVSVTLSGTLTYSRGAQTLATATSHGCTYYLALGSNGSSAPSSGWTNGSLTATNAGTYYIWYKGTPDSNHSNTISATYKGSVTINKVTPVISTNPSNTSPTYNGSALNLLSGGAMKHSSSNSTAVAGTFSYLQGTNAGSYSNPTWSFTPTDTTNYNSTSGTRSGTTTTIAKQSLSSVTITLSWTSRSYNGSVQVPTTTVKSGSTTLTSGTHYTLSYSNSSSKNAGSYSITASATSNYSFTAVSASYSITKIDPTYSAPTAKSGLIYSGSSLTLYNAGSNTTSGSFSYSNGSRTDAGSQTVSWTFTPTDTTNYNTKSGSFNVSIATRPINVTAGSNSKTYDRSALTYNSATAESTGTNRGLVSGHSMTSCTVTGTITNVGSTNNVPSSAVIKLGSTNVTSNYNINYVNGTLTVTTRTITLNWGTLTWTYDGSAHSTTCTAGNVCSGDTCTITLSGNSITNKGTTTVTASSLSNSNYSLPSTKTATLTINARSVTYRANDESWTYNGNTRSASNTATLTSGSLASGHSATFSCTGSVGPNVGTATKTLSSVTIKNSGGTNVSNNYSITRNNGTLSIIKANQSAPTATDLTTTYNGSVTGSASGGGGVGSLYYRSDANGGTNYGTATTTAPSRSSVGTTKYIAYWGGNGNYNASPNSAAKSLVVNKYTPTVTLSATNRAYNGSALYASATVSSPSGGTTPKGTIYYGTSSGATTYSVTYSGSAVNLSSVSVTNYNNGSGNSVTVYAYFVPDSTCKGVYNNSGNASKTMTITGKANLNAPTATGATTTYNTIATATATGGGGQGTLTWTNGNTQTSVGTKNTKAYWAGNGNYNASGYSNEVTLTMKPRIDSEPTDAGRTYNKSALNLLTGGTASPSGGTWNYSLGTNAGSYDDHNSSYPKATWTYTLNGVSVSGSKAATIYPAWPIYTSAPVNKDNLKYDGSAKALCTAGVVGSLPGHFEYRTNGSGSWSSYSTSLPTATNANENGYSYYWKFVPDDTINYCEDAGLRTGIKILKRNVTLTWTSAPSSVNVGESITVSATKNYGTGSITYRSSSNYYTTVSGNIVTGVRAGSTYIYADYAGDDNHNEASIYYTLTVNDPYNGHAYVEIAGLKWATMNVGATSITGDGLYFQWGDTQGYTASQCGSGDGQKYFGWADYKYGTNPTLYSADMTKYNDSDGKTVLEVSDDAARANWGGSWRMPTAADFQALGSAVNTEWASNYQGSGVSGMICTDKTDSSKVLFFPACGSCNIGIGNNGKGSGGGYWSRSLKSDNVHYAYYLNFFGPYLYWQGNNGRYYGFTVRGVVG